MKDGVLSEIDGRYELRFVRPLSHPVEKVWAAITEPEGLRAWFPFDIEGERATGAPLRFVFREEEGGDFTGSMVEFTPRAAMELVWEDDETLRLELVAGGDGCVLTLINASTRSARPRATPPAGTPAWTRWRRRWPAVESTRTPLGRGAPGLRRALRPEAATLGPPTA